MARGVKGSGVQVAGQPMTSEDISLAQERIEGKRSPLHEDDFKEVEEKMATRNILKTEDGRRIAQVGNFNTAQVYGDSQTLKKFARIEPDYTGWTKMTNAQALLYQDLRLLAGHDGDKRLGLLDIKKFAKIKQDGKQGLLSEKDMETLEQLEALK